MHGIVGGYAVVVLNREFVSKGLVGLSCSDLAPLWVDPQFSGFITYGRWTTLHHGCQFDDGERDDLGLLLVR
jgi:hypothetical protein